MSGLKASSAQTIRKCGGKLELFEIEGAHSDCSNTREMPCKCYRFYNLIVRFDLGAEPQQLSRACRECRLTWKFMLSSDVIFFTIFHTLSLALERCCSGESSRDRSDLIKYLMSKTIDRFRRASIGETFTAPFSELRAHRTQYTAQFCCEFLFCL